MSFTTSFYQALGTVGGQPAQVLRQTHLAPPVVGALSAFGEALPFANPIAGREFSDCLTAAREGDYSVHPDMVTVVEERNLRERLLIADIIRLSRGPTARFFESDRQILSQARKALGIPSDASSVINFNEVLKSSTLPNILRTFTAESSPPKLALLKESLIQLLWEVDRALILSGFREAMTSVDPDDSLATNAILIASWFGGDMAKAVRKMWPDPKDTTPSALALRSNLLLLLKEIGLPSWTTLEKLKMYDPTFGPNIDRIRSEISQKTMRPEREIRAQFDGETVTVYQAFSESLGQAAVEKQSLDVGGFKMTRTTWIKPSFTWILSRSGYGMKEAGQSRILAIRLRREVFEQLLRERENRNVQWDPERRVDLAPLPYRTIQIGVRPKAMKTYLDGIVEIIDMTPTAHAIYQLVHIGKIREAEALLPEEKPYPTVPRE